MKSFLNIISTIAIFLVFIFLPKQSFGQEVGLVPAHPDINVQESFSSFNFQVDPGEEIEDEFSVVNLNDQETEIDLFLDNSESSWIEMESNQITLDPNQRKNVGFKVQVPQDASPGDHNFKIESQGTVLGVKISVNGNAKKELTVTDIKFSQKEDGLEANLTIKNSGEITIDSLSLKVNLINKWLGKTNNEEFFWPLEKEIAPGQTESLSLVSEKKLPFLVKGKIDWQIVYGEDLTKSGEENDFFYVNWKKWTLALFSLLAAIGLFIIILIRTVRLIRKITRRPKKTRKIKKSEKIKSPVDSKRIDSESIELMIRKIVRQELEISNQISAEKDHSKTQ